MDPFTQRMLERAKARKEKLENKIAPSDMGIELRQKKILTEINQASLKPSPIKKSKSPSNSLEHSVSKIEKTLTFNTDSEGNYNKDEDIAVQINIVHQNNVQVEVQVEEREISLTDYLLEKENNAKLLKNKSEKEGLNHLIKVKKDVSESKENNSKDNLREDAKLRLKKLGKLYSEGQLSSPIHQSKEIFVNDTESTSQSIESAQEKEQSKTKKFGRLAALADQINNWEDDTTHHNFKTTSNISKKETLSFVTQKNSPVKSFLDKEKSIMNQNSKNDKTNSPIKSKQSSNQSPVNKIVEKFRENIVSSVSSKKENCVKSNIIQNSNSPIKTQTVVPKSSNKNGSNNSSKVFQPLIVGSCLKKENAKKNWDKSVLDDLEAQGFKRVSNGRLVCELDAMAAACAPPQRLERRVSTKKRAAPPPPVQPPPPPPVAPATQPVEASSSDSSPYGTPIGERRGRDPLHMSVREKKAMFEKGATNAAEKRRGATNLNIKPKVDEKIAIVPVHATFKPPVSITQDTDKLTISEKEISEKTKREIQEDMNVILKRHQKPDLDAIENDEDQSSESSPLMGNNVNHSSSVSNLSTKKTSVTNSPKVVIHFNTPETTSVIDDTDALRNTQPTKRTSMDSPLVISTIEDVKRIKVAQPQPGRLYPNISDIEAQSEESCLSSSDSSFNENIGKENWGDTSFGREVLEAAGVTNTSLKTLTPSSNNSSQLKKGGIKRKDDSSDDSFVNSNLDELLDEAFDEEDMENNEPPSKLNKGNNLNATLPSNSFYFKKGHEPEYVEKFKSPLKITPKKDCVSEETNEKKPLVHTISFYRKQQNQNSQPATPMKIIRIEHENNQDDVAEKARREAQLSAQESRQRIKELLEEVAKQNTVISQTSQALNLCVSTIEFNGSPEQAEVERILLLATHRRQACLHEVQRIQVEGISVSSNHAYILDIEELCLPLRRDYVRQLNADGAVGHYLACLIKCQDRVLATTLEKTNPDSFTVTFPDKFKLEGLDADFKVTVEVYILQASKEVLPHNVKYHIATKKSGKLATPRKGVRGADLKAPPQTSPGGPSAVRSPVMQSQGYCIFSIQQTNRNSFSLNKPYNNGPLEGCLRVKLSCQRYLKKNVVNIVHRGFLTMFEEAGGFGAWHRRWCVLNSGDLSYWKYPDDEKKKMPIGSVELSTVISETVRPAPRDLCARQNTLLVETSLDNTVNLDTSNQTAHSLIVANGIRRYLLAADTKPDRDAWMTALNEALAQIRDNLAS